MECGMSSFLRAGLLSIAGVVVILSAARLPPAHACAFDSDASVGLFGSGFQTKYPKSSEVYFATIDALEQGVLPRSAFDVVTGSAGYWRAAGRLKSLQLRLSTVAELGSRPGRAISIVFIESDLWARLEREPQGFDLVLHTPGAREGDVVVVTTEGAVAAIMDGRLSADVAFERDLVAIDSDAGSRALVQKLLMNAFESAPNASPTADGRAAPMRFFGPRR
jgi:hypothetical protein